MSTEYRAVVEGGGKNLYRIEEYGDTFYVYSVSVRIPINKKESVGKTDSLESALALIMADSGEDIREVEEI
jgi:hypothetical protein